MLLLTFTFLAFLHFTLKKEVEILFDDEEWARTKLSPLLMCLRITNRIDGKENQDPKANITTFNQQMICCMESK